MGNKEEEKKNQTKENSVKIIKYKEIPTRAMMQRDKNEGKEKKNTGMAIK